VTDTNSTFTGVGPQGRAGLWTGRAALALVACVVLAGVAGLLGVRTETVEAGGSGYTISLDYPRSARAGLDVVWTATISRQGGFEGPVTLAVTGDYFDIFETQGLFPEPDSQTRDADSLYLTFAKPPNDTLVVSYDAYVQPASQIGRDGTLAVVADGDRVAAVDFRTWLAP
jgi:hypothetical protein